MDHGQLLELILTHGVPKVRRRTLETILVHIARRMDKDVEPVRFTSATYTDNPKLWPLKGEILVIDEDGRSWAIFGHENAIRVEERTAGADGQNESQA